MVSGSVERLVPGVRGPGEGAHREFAWIPTPAGSALTLLQTVERPSRVGVLIVPPIGWDNMASYTPRARWADLLVGRGTPVLRFDLPSTGDSAATPYDPGLVDSWVATIIAAAAQLRSRSGCASVLAIGFSLGGLLALRACADGAEIDDLALWACPASGVSFIRELTAFSRLEASRLERGDRDSSRGTLPADSILAGGYLFTSETLEAVRGLVPASMELDAGERHRALLLGRGREPDARLQQALRDHGLVVTTDPGDGYEGMLVEPQFAQLPTGAVEVVARFIDEIERDAGSTPRTPSSTDATRVSGEATIALAEGRSVRETVARIDHGDAELVGVLATPTSESSTLGALLIGGTGHRMGPNRMWTELCRSWASRGVCTMRIDIAGAGDARTSMPPSVADLYTDPDIVDQVRAAVADLRQRTGCTTVLVVGLCAGGFWAIKLALADPEIVPVCLNLPLLRWNEIDRAEHTSRLYRGKLRQARTLRRILVGDVDFGNAMRLMPVVLGLRRRRAGVEDELSPQQILEALGTRRRSTWFVFAGRESLGDDMAADGPLDLGRWPVLHREAFGSRSDLHTLRPLWLQQMLMERLDQAIEQERARLSDASRD